MSRISLDHNLGILDRLLRGGFGFSLIYKGARSSGPLSPLMMLGGVLLAAPGLTGTDPILRRFGISTRPGDENFFMNLINKGKPGHGVKPLATEQPCPNQLHRSIDLSEGQPLAAALAIG